MNPPHPSPVTIAPKPCPNPECDGKAFPKEVLMAGTPKQYAFNCSKRCGYESPRAKTKEEAIRLHNLIATRAAIPQEQMASSECPICGKNEPHGHDREQISAWVNGRLAAWGWKAHIYNEFTDKPYGWYYYPHHVGILTRFSISKPDDIGGWIPLYTSPPLQQAVDVEAILEPIHKCWRMLQDRGGFGGAPDALFIALDRAREIAFNKHLVSPREGWQPIETAPKDGQAIVLCQIPHSWVGIGRYVHSEKPQWALESGHRVWATHWMNIPAAPASPPLAPTVREKK